MKVNKPALLKSIKSVSGFLALTALALWIFTLGLIYVPMVTIPSVIVLLFAFMVYTEYKINNIK